MTIAVKRTEEKVNGDVTENADSGGMVRVMMTTMIMGVVRKGSISHLFSHLLMKLHTGDMVVEHSSLYMCLSLLSGTTTTTNNN